MTRPIQSPERRTKRLLAHYSRAIVTVRQYGGSTVIPLPKPIRTALNAGIGDRVLIEYDPAEQIVTIKKDSESVRHTTLERIDNLRQLSNHIKLLNDTEEYGKADWCREIENTVRAMVKHLKGEKLDVVLVPSEEDV